MENVRSVYIDILLRRIGRNEKDFSMLWSNADMAILLSAKRLQEEQELMKKWNFKQQFGTTKWCYFLTHKRCEITTEVWTSPDPDDLGPEDYSALAPLLGPNLPGGFIVHCKFFPEPFQRKTLRKKSKYSTP